MKIWFNSKIKILFVKKRKRSYYFICGKRGFLIGLDNFYGLLSSETNLRSTKIYTKIW